MNLSSDYETRRLLDIRDDRAQAEAAWAAVLHRDYLTAEESEAAKRIASAMESAARAGDAARLLDLERQFYVAMSDATFPECGLLDEEEGWIEDCGEPLPSETERAASYDALMGPAAKLLPLLNGSLRRSWERVSKAIETAAKAGLGEPKIEAGRDGRMRVTFPTWTVPLVINDLAGAARVFVHGDEMTLHLEQRLGRLVESVVGPKSVDQQVWHSCIPLQWINIRANHNDEVQLIEEMAAKHGATSGMQPLKVQWYANAVYLSRGQSTAWLSRTLVPAEVEAAMQAIAAQRQAPAAREVTLFGYSAQGVAL